MVGHVGYKKSENDKEADVHGLAKIDIIREVLEQFGDEDWKSDTKALLFLSQVLKKLRVFKVYRFWTNRVLPRRREKAS